MDTISLHHKKGRKTRLGSLIPLCLQILYFLLYSITSLVSTQNKRSHHDLCLFIYHCRLFIFTTHTTLYMIFTLLLQGSCSLTSATTDSTLGTVILQRGGQGKARSTGCGLRILPAGLATKLGRTCKSLMSSSSSKTAASKYKTMKEVHTQSINRLLVELLWVNDSVSLSHPDSCSHCSQNGVCLAFLQ